MYVTLTETQISHQITLYILMDNYNKEEPDNNLYISTWITLSERHFKPKHPPPTSLRQALEHYPYVCVWDMAAHVPVPLYLGYVCLCLLSS